MVLAAAGMALAGCSSFSLPSMPSMDFFTPAPPVITLQLDSKPAGATATTSAGPGCRTPCAVQVTAAPGAPVTVTYTLDRHLPQTVSLQIVQHQGPSAPDGTAPIVTDFDPNPVFVELQPAAPPRKMRQPPPKRRTAARPPINAAVQPASASPAISSPFPPPPPAASR